jgi:hypothetical protein
LESVDRTFSLRMTVRMCRQVTVVHRTQLTGECLIDDGHPGLIMQPLAKINDPLAHYAMDPG